MRKGLPTNSAAVVIILHRPQSFLSSRKATTERHTIAAVSERAPLTCTKTNNYSLSEQLPMEDPARTAAQHQLCSQLSFSLESLWVFSCPPKVLSLSLSLSFLSFKGGRKERELVEFARRAQISRPGTEEDNNNNKNKIRRTRVCGQRILALTIRSQETCHWSNSSVESSINWRRDPSLSTDDGCAALAVTSVRFQPPTSSVFQINFLPYKSRMMGRTSNEVIDLIVTEAS